MSRQSALSQNASQRAEVEISDPRTKGLGSNADEIRSASKTYPIAESQPVEPEDAYLTGVSRSLQRRLLGLNVNITRKPRPGVEAPELGSAGSRVGAASVPAPTEKNLKSA